jgi:hypothetical protein
VALARGCSIQKIVRSTGVRTPSRNHIRFALDDGHTYLYVGDGEGFSVDDNFVPGTSLEVCKPSKNVPYYRISSMEPGGIYERYRRLK